MDKKGEGYHTALIWGLILLILFGGLLPLILSDFAPESSNLAGYLTPVENIIKFYSWGAFESFLLSQLNGFSIIPIALSIPLLLISFGLLIYGTLKLLPETEVGSIIAGLGVIGTAIAGLVGAIFGG